MMKWCFVTFGAVMFADCVAVWASDADAAAVLADVLVLSVVAAVLAAVTVWNAVVELPAAAASAPSVAKAGCFAVECVAVAAYFAVERVAATACFAVVRVHESAAELTSRLGCRQRSAPCSFPFCVGTFAAACPYV